MLWGNENERKILGTQQRNDNYSVESKSNKWSYIIKDYFLYHNQKQQQTPLKPKICIIKEKQLQVKKKKKTKKNTNSNQNTCAEKDGTDSNFAETDGMTSPKGWFVFLLGNRSVLCGQNTTSYHTCPTSQLLQAWPHWLFGSLNKWSSSLPEDHCPSEVWTTVSSFPKLSKLLNPCASVSSLVKMGIMIAPTS